jgi:hypothetical protein
MRNAITNCEAHALGGWRPWKGALQHLARVANDYLILYINLELELELQLHR